MQTSPPTSRFSLLKSSKAGSISRRRPNDEPTRSAESQLSSPGTSQTSSAASSRDEPDTGGRAPGRPPLGGDARLHSSGSVRRAHPARYRAAHPDQLDPLRDLDAESTEDGSEDDEDDEEEETDSYDSSEGTDDGTDHRTSAEDNPHATLRASSKWSDDADALRDDSQSEHAPIPMQQPRHPRSAAHSMTEEEMRQAADAGAPFHGLSDYPLDLGKSRRLIDDDYLKSAFGITRSRRESEDNVRHRLAVQHEAMQNEPIPPLPSSEEMALPRSAMASPRSEKSDFFEMEVPLGLDPRMMIPPPIDGEGAGEIIPEVASERSSLEIKTPRDHDDPSSTASSASTLKQARLAQQLQGESATAVAIISPDQVLESPKPRRPFSTVSIEGMTQVPNKKASPALAVKSAASNSSEETSGQDGKASDRSGGSSMSSVASPPATTKAMEHDLQPDRRPKPTNDLLTPIALDEQITPMSESEMTPMNEMSAMYQMPPMDDTDDTTSMYHMALSSRPSKSAASHQRARPEMWRQSSDISLSNSFAGSITPNVNKPLPPEPGRRTNTLSHISEQSGSSRDSAITIRPEQQQPDIGLTIETAIAVHPSRPVNVHRMDSRVSTLSGWSLRSKYSPKDLDALDDAFVQRDPPAAKSQQSLVPSFKPMSPSQSQTSLQDGHLDVIREASPQVPRPNQERSHHKTSFSDPHQRTRAPMRMEPSRRAPQPPSSRTSTRKNSLISLYNDKQHQQQQQQRPHPVQQRSQSSNHIGAQQKLGEEPSVQRSATMGIGSPTSKADRVLGKTYDMSPPPHSAHIEANWPRQGSPEPMSATLSHPTSAHPHSAHPGSSRDQFVSPIEGSRDAHFAEIQERMQLLRPRDESDHSPQERDSPTDPRYVGQRTSPRSKRITPLAELPAQHGSPKVRGRSTEFALVELEGSDPGRHRRIPLLRQPPPPGNQSGRFKPPTPPPPPQSGTPPPTFDRRGRPDRSDPVMLQPRPGRSSPSQRSTKVRSIASLVASEIPDIYACLPSNATNSVRPSMTAEEAEQMISAEAAERVLYRILQHLQNFQDLFAAAQVSRGFYRTFKRHELSLLKSALYRMSPPAWELREISIPRLELLEDGTDGLPNLYFSHYMRDSATMIELKALILEHCRPFLREGTVRDLSAEPDQQTKIDEAFWRIWTFCKIFGAGSHRENDVVGQMDWLKGGRLASQSVEVRRAALPGESGRKAILHNPPAGFAAGNGRGLTADELYDMTEVWTCLEVLVRGYLGQRELAREFGVFDRLGVPRGDDIREDALLEEWTHFLMSRGPHVVFRVAAPSMPTKEKFSRVQAEGLTDWKPLSNGSSRATFLKEALSHVYDEQMRQSHPLMASSPKGFSDLPQVVSPGIGSFSQSAMNRQSRFYAPPPDQMQMMSQQMYGDMPQFNERSPIGAGPMSAPMSAPLTSNFRETLSKLESIDTGSKPSTSRFGRRRNKTTETTDQRQRRMNLEAIISPTSASKNSPITPSPAANTFQGGNKGGRLTKMKSRVTGKSPVTPTSAGMPKSAVQSRFAFSGSGEHLRGSEVSLPSMPSIDAVSINTQSDTLASMGSSELQSEDPLAPMVDQLMAMGFEEPKARKALAKNTNQNFIDFEQALASLVKQREIRKKMERLDRMG